MRLVPGLLMPKRSRVWARARENGGLVTMLRLVFSALVSALVWVIAPLVLFGLDAGGRQRTAGIVFVILVGLAALIAETRLIRGALFAATRDDIVATYRGSVLTRFFVAEAPILVGFVLAFVTGSFWTYVVGLVAAAPSLYLAAPTAVDIARQQANLADRGFDIDLMGVLLLEAD